MLKITLTKSLIGFAANQHQENQQHAQAPVGSRPHHEINSFPGAGNPAAVRKREYRREIRQSTFLGSAPL